MNVDILLENLNQTIALQQGRPLNSVETLLLKGIWQQQTYIQTAEEIGYSAGYLTNVVAPDLLHKLSDLVGRRVTKKNCRILLEAYASTHIPLMGQFSPGTSCAAHPPSEGLSPSFPSGAIAASSPFYIERPPIENQVYTELCKPGALVRIKAPKEMGKTSLILRTLEFLRQQGYLTVYLNLEQLDLAICGNLNRFLRSLCASITRQLEIDPKLDDYWDEDIGSKVSCSLYLRQHLLEQLQSPLIVAIDELNRIFEYPQVAQDFLPLLRSWYEESKRVPAWQNLRLIVAHSTEVYVPLQINQSPFNVGLAVQLAGFTEQQVLQLAQRYRLDWTKDASAQRLMAIAGNHPALIHTAIYHLAHQKQTLSELLDTALAPTGIYHHHLQRHWITLQQQPNLAKAFYRLLQTQEPVSLEADIAHQLISMGLIDPGSGRETRIRCELYRQYFQSQPIPAIDSVSSWS
jgi:hypothetical protein